MCGDQSISQLTLISLWELSLSEWSEHLELVILIIPGLELVAV